MISIRKLCCCFSQDPPENELQDFKTHSNETITTLGKTGSSQKTLDTPTLILTVLETTHMTHGQKFIITPKGLQGSQSKSPSVHAGSSKSSDIVLPEAENGVGKRHFLIKFYREKQGYFLKDSGEGLGTFIRLDKPYEISSSNIVSFGDSHMILTLDNSFITLSFIQGPKADYKTYQINRTYSQEDSPIRIGRMNDCDIRFEDTSLSRYHCYLFYENCWKIQDGDGKKFSTNGTWLFVDQPTELLTDSIFKAGESLFKCSLNNEI